MKKIFFSILIVLIVVLIFYYCKKYSGIAVYSKGYGHPKDTVETLFDRMEWANHYKGRDAIFLRHFLYSLVITFVVLSVLENRLPSIQKYFQGVFLVFLMLQTFYNYFQYHAEKFAHFSIEDNIKLLRKKLKLKKGRLSKIWYTKFPGASPCRNFSYKSDL